VDMILKQSTTAIHLDRVYETDMAEGLKAMALEGHGIAFLPYSAVKKELRARKLVSAGEGLEMTMDIRVYREKPTPRDAAKTSAEALWLYLQAQTRPKPAGKPPSK
ncbi:MAG: LysR family transcriptional regulator, partial [Comamonadaceae bacterium]